MNRYMRIASVAVLAGMLHGCTWVKPTPEGEFVRVAAANAVTDCKRMSKVTVSLKNRVAGVERNSEKVARELATLARNEGGRLGGDTVVAESEISGGSQTFAIYDCR